MGEQRAKVILDKSGMPLDKNQRLPSLRVPRDLMMGRPKKVFTPNLAKALSRKTKETKTNEINHGTNKEQTKEIKNNINKETRSQKNLSNKKRETIQSFDSVFAQGPANFDVKSKGCLITVGRENNYNSNKINSFKKENKTPTSNASNLFFAGDKESQFVKNFVTKSEADDIFHTKPEIVDPSDFPIKLPLTNALEKLGKEIKMGNAVFKKDSFDVVNNICPQEFDLNNDPLMSTYNLWDLIQHENLLNSPNNPLENSQNLYLFHFPTQTPFAFSSPTPVSDKTNVPTPVESKLERIGKLQISTSGQIFFQSTPNADDNLQSQPMELTRSLPKSFLQNLVSIKLEANGDEESKNGTLTNYGHIKDQFILKPALDKFLSS